MPYKVLFKWNGHEKDLKNYFTKETIENNIGLPVTSKRNLGIWRNGHFINCNIEDYVVLDLKGKLGVVKNGKTIK